MFIKKLAFRDNLRDIIVRINVLGELFLGLYPFKTLNFSFQHFVNWGNFDNEPHFFSVQINALMY